MAKTKETPAKSAKPAAAKAGNSAAAPRASVATRKPAKTALDAPGSGQNGAQPTPEQLYRMIQETAYYKAKARNFAPGHEVQDWIEAEAEVRERLS